MPSYPLEPDKGQLAELGDAVLRRALGFLDELPHRPASQVGDLAVPMAPPGEEPGELGALLDAAMSAADEAVETAGPRYLAYFPAGGLFTSALADLLSRVTNRFVGVADLAPGLVRLEQSVLRWLCDVFTLPATATGVLTSGGSLANLSAVVTARHVRLGDDFRAGTAYVSAHAHHSVVKAARIAGLPVDQVRVVACTSELRMDVAAAARMIDEDRARGLRPFLVVGSAGTTDTGTVDPLPELAELADDRGMWFHADAAYGGFFQLTERGRNRLRGIEAADSITLDPHKSLFLPYGTGALLVRDGEQLRDAHRGGGHYLQDLAADGDLPDFSAHGVELTREARGLRMWLPLHLHGLAAFRAALDEKLDLADRAHAALAADPRFETPVPPDLTVVTFRLADADDARTRLLHERVNATRRVFLSSTSIDGRFTLRLCILSLRAHAEHVDEALDVIRAATDELRAGS